MPADCGVIDLSRDILSDTLVQIIPASELRLDTVEMVSLDEFDNIVAEIEGGKKRYFSSKTGYKIQDSYWDDFESTFGAVPFGFNGSGVFEMGISSDVKKLSEIAEINDGRPWKKKILVKRTFKGCDNHCRYYQDCSGYYECPSENCSARELFGAASQNFTKHTDKIQNKVTRSCSSCNQEMVRVYCHDISIQDKEGKSPPCRRIIDLDYCHNVLTVKYAGEHSCVVKPKVKPMDVDFVKSYFKNHPSSTPDNFKDFAINEAMNKNENVEEVALQYADTIKIRNIQAAQRKENDPDGSGLNYLQKLSVSLKNNGSINDPYLLEVCKDPVRMLMSKLLSSADHDNAESVSIDFCESQLKDYSVMMVSTYSRDLRQLVPLHQFIFQKPGESADNVELALKKVDERMQQKFGIDFNPKQWTSDNSGAIENGIIRVKG